MEAEIHIYLSFDDVIERETIKQSKEFIYIFMRIVKIGFPKPERAIFTILYG